ncbi:MAG TPA: zinc ribbon domain-containing protein [Methanolinea sp.]|jgi:TM2 domain-containing membrane protein YozV|nr:MAG: TM2 domain protein [Methanoregulaceae archaeon PtaB.Bin009]OPY40957.1 MAG: TM2 domain protein [Methanoregulaceae archaeon PtaU1.Bin066]HII75869.1 zinc ribbon domain-containing protein [Methanolinea sp.]HNQ28802.1 zinc-ribbon domain-containing protein [Methanolinea sp.]
MAQFCESCGARIKEGDKFCEQCGAIVPGPAGVPQAQGAPGEVAHPPKNPTLALILSFFFSGLGQIYNGDTLKGVAIYFGTLIGALLFIVPGIIVWIYGVYDAYTTAKKMNEGTVPYKKTNTLFMIGFVVMVLVIGGIVLIMSLALV